ncbi:MAG: nucleoside triphosphate pyrophosphohydrolase [Granulosicoccaceae bacterium]
MSSVSDLLELMRELRHPERGCPWDQKQSFKTIAPYTIEEAYEVADAVERESLDELKDELGDLLFQVVFHAQMADEICAFDFDDVAKGIVDKMRRRHPHVFGDVAHQPVADASDVNQAWEASKAAEREGASVGKRVSVLDGIALTLPALMRAEKIQKRAARVGFDWPVVDNVWKKMDEEFAEVREAAQLSNEAARADALEDELGDVLFVAVNLARHYKVDAEKALRRANGKFEKRFRQVEALAADEQQLIQEMDLASLDALWNKAKQLN